MSFLAGRLAGKEAAYFIQESKHAVGRLLQKNTTQKFPAQPPPSSHSPADGELQADILPEVLRHSLPSKIFREQSADSNGSLVTSKWVLPSDPNRRSVSSDALNPLRAFLTLPQVTFGPKRFVSLPICLSFPIDFVSLFLKMLNFELELPVVLVFVYLNFSA